MKVIALIVLLLIGLASYVFYNNSLNKASEQPGDLKVEEKANYKASFIIFTNGTLRDFSEPKYHNRSEGVFITAENPTQILVKRKGITWNDFFKTLPAPMKLTKDCLYTGTGQEFCNGEAGSLKFFLNGVRDENFLSREIQNGDKALISYGNETESQLQAQLRLLE